MQVLTGGRVVVGVGDGSPVGLSSPAVTSCRLPLVITGHSRRNHRFRSVVTCLRQTDGQTDEQTELV